MSAAWIALFVALWLVVLLLAVLMLGLIRKVVSFEADMGRGARGPSYVGGPPLGTRAPSGVHRGLTSSPENDHGRLVLFLSSSCGACRRLADELRTEGLTAATSEWPTRDFELVVVTDPKGRDTYGDLDPGAIVVQANGELSRAWSVPGTPFAVAVDGDGVVRAAAFASTLANLDELGLTLAATVGPGFAPVIADDA